MNKIRGLDAIRFVCAFWVMLGHYDLGHINTTGHAHSHAASMLAMATKALGATIVDIAAVMVFFVISGFCIRFPFRHGEAPAWGEYFARRYLRIGIPMGVAIVLVHLAGRELTIWENLCLWSLYAEVIYYTLYPLLMLAQRKVGWNVLFAGSSAAAVLLLVLHPPQGVDRFQFQAFGVWLNWILGLPVWLLGCRLADESDALTGARVPSIWLWRGGTWLASFLCGLLRFHGGVGHAYTMVPFAVVVFFWLRQEIRHYRRVTPPAALEAVGSWSYSLYLMHLPAYWLFTTVLLPRLPLGAGPIFALRVVFGLACAYGFYLLVERPSHWLARQFKRRKTDKPAPFAPAEPAPEPSAQV